MSVPLFQLIHTPEGDRMDAYAALYEAVDVEVSDDLRRARAAGPRETRQHAHEYGECVRGVSVCPVHRKEYRRRNEQRKTEQRRAQQERAQAEREQQTRQAAMNTYRVNLVLEGVRRSQAQERVLAHTKRGGK